VIEEADPGLRAHATLPIEGEGDPERGLRRCPDDEG
jgi:hypothetical protein